MYLGALLIGAASAVDAAAARATLALAPVLFCTSNVHDHSFLVALLSLDDVQGVAGSLLNALGLVRTVAVSARRHDFDLEKGLKGF